MSSFCPLPLPSISEEGYFSLSPFLSFCASSVHSRVSRNSGGLSFSSGSSRCYIRLIAPKVGKAFSDSLISGDSLCCAARRILEALAAYREGQILYKLGTHEILRPAEKRDRVLVTKIPNGKERIASRLD